MKTTTRRGFLGALASATVAGAASGAKAAIPAPPLDATFTSDIAPGGFIRFPSAWHSYEQLVLGLTSPRQVGFVSSQRLQPAHWLEQGLPDVRACGLPEKGSLVAVYSYDAPRDLSGDFTLPFAGAPRIADFDRGESPLYPGFDFMHRTYVAGDQCLGLFAWIGDSSADRQAVVEIIESFRLAAPKV